MSKLHIRIILKNGAEFTVECDEFELAKDGFGNLKSYRIEGITKNKPIYIDFTQVAAILNVMSSETGGAE